MQICGFTIAAFIGIFHSIGPAWERIGAKKHLDEVNAGREHRFNYSPGLLIELIE